MCDVTPLTSAIDSGGSEKEKKMPIFFAGFGCPRLYSTISTSSSSSTLSQLLWKFKHLIVYLADFLQQFKSR
jgi:hypothetical protein